MARNFDVDRHGYAADTSTTPGGSVTPPRINTEKKMKCKYCLQEIGQIKEVYIALCKLSKHKYGIVLTNEKGEFVGWVSETRMYCKNCRPSAMYTARNWTLATT